MDQGALLGRTAELAGTFLAGLDERRVGGPVDLAALRASFGGPLPASGEEAQRVVEELARAADPGIVATAGPRYFGFVIGGSQPAALAADWLTSAWDQNAALYVMSPAAAVAEEVVERWLVELFGLPAGTSCGFTSGATMANFTALAAGRHAPPSSSATKRTRRSSPRSRCWASAAGECTRWQQTGRAACNPMPCAGPSPGCTGRPSSPSRLAT